jgi:hypothetical protein
VLTPKTLAIFYPHAPAAPLFPYHIAAPQLPLWGKITDKLLMYKIIY